MLLVFEMKHSRTNIDQVLTKYIRNSQPPGMFCKKSDLANFTGKRLCKSLVLITLSVKKTPRQVFSCAICQILG